MGVVTPGETLGTLYNIHVGSNKTKQHKTQAKRSPVRAANPARFRAAKLLLEKIQLPAAQDKEYA